MCDVRRRRRSECCCRVNMLMKCETSPSLDRAKLKYQLLKSVLLIVEWTTTQLSQNSFYFTERSLALLFCWFPNFLYVVFAKNFCFSSFFAESEETLNSTQKQFVCCVAIRPGTLGGFEAGKSFCNIYVLMVLLNSWVCFPHTPAFFPNPIRTPLTFSTSILQLQFQFQSHKMYV